MLCSDTAAAAAAAVAASAVFVCMDNIRSGIKENFMEMNYLFIWFISFFLLLFL